VEGPYRQGETKYLTEAAAQNCGDAILNSKRRLTGLLVILLIMYISELEEEMV